MAGIRNRILRRLSPEKRRLLASDLKTVHLANSQIVYDSDAAIRKVCFPETAVVSIICLVKEGGIAEIGMVGCEGVVGLDVVLGGISSTARAMCQVPGEALMMDAEVFKRHMRESDAFRMVLLDYARSYCAMLAQLIACNRLHRVEQRAARWLSMTADRIEQSSFPMTQERLGMMLGTQRPTVNAAMAGLRDAGCIENSRGRVRIIDRKKLEARACECYLVCTTYFQSLFPIVDRAVGPSGLKSGGRVVAAVKKAQRGTP